MTARPTLTSSSDGIYVEGLKEFQAELKKAKDRTPKELTKANRFAAKTIAEPARARAEDLGGVARHVAASIRAGATQRGAFVVMGGPRYPMAMGANFGAYHFEERQTSRGPVEGWNQFPNPVRPDRIIYRTIAEEHEHFIRVYENMIDTLMKGPFPR